MEIMIRCTISVTPIRKTEPRQNQYGFDPEAGERLKGNYSGRFTQAQAIRLLGVSRSKFYKDRKAGLVKENGDEARPWFKGMDLYQYWWNSIRGWESEDYIEEKITEKRTRNRQKTA